MDDGGAAQRWRVVTAAVFLLHNSHPVTRAHPLLAQSGERVFPDASPLVSSSTNIACCLLSFVCLCQQYWLGGSPENVESLLLTLAKSYVPEVIEMGSVEEKDIAEPVLLPDKGIWHPVADKVFENADEYLTWYNQVCAWWG